MYEPIQSMLRKLDMEIRSLDRMIDDLEIRAYREKIDAKVHVYREIGFLRRRRDQLEHRSRMIAEMEAEMALPARG